MKLYEVKSKLIIGSCLLLLLVNASFCQGTWIQKANFGGISRVGAVGFSIATKGYIGTGYNGTSLEQDFWEWDQTTNVWTQKANFGGTPRAYAVGFSIGIKGYIGTGNDAHYLTQDFWEWDQATNVWIQKANFAGTGRNSAVGFSIINKGYIGTGYDAGSSYLKDFWEYNPSINIWVKKADFKGTARWNAVGFSIMKKGYIGTGYDGTYKQDFWEWDQATDVWTQKANFGGTARAGAVGFFIGANGYIGTGNDGTYKNDFWKWNGDSLSPAYNTWVQEANFVGTARNAATGFSIGCKGYIGTGSAGSSQTPQKDFWEYAPLPVKATIFSSIDPLCFGRSVTLTTGGGSNYLWSNGSTNNPIVAYPSVTTNYSVLVSDGCTSDSIAKTITVIPAPTALFNFHTDLCTSSIQFTDNSIAANSWLWNFGDEHSSSSQNPTHKFTLTGNFIVTLIVRGSSICSDTEHLSINIPDPFSDLFIPNAFSPNGDGENDVFKLLGISECINTLHIEIFNRLGEKVYESSNPFFQWDGNYSNGISDNTQKIGSEVLVYYAEVGLIDGRKIARKGNISLMR